MKARLERRLVPLEGFEFRAAKGDSPPELVGYASVFNQETVIADWFSEWREEVSPGAFKKTLKEADIRALWNHDPNIVLGRNKSGTLDLSEDDHGLMTVIRPPDNEWGRPVLDAVRRGDVSGMSITFAVIKDEMLWPEKGSQELPKRTIKEARLYDVAPVTFPAFEQTEINARAEVGRDGALPLQEDVLLRAGAMARRAQMGMVLTAEERGTLSEAVSILEGELGKPVAASTPLAVCAEDGTNTQARADRNHSPEAADGESGGNADIAIHHSAEARARRLRLMRAQTQGEPR